MGNLVSVNTATEVKKIINESINSVKQQSDAQCVQQVQQSFAVLAEDDGSVIDACGGINLEQQLNAQFACIQGSLKDAAFRNRLAADIVTRLKAAKDGPSGELFQGISVNTAVSDQTVIDRVSQTLEQISNQNCTQNVAQGATIIARDGGQIIVGERLPEAVLTRAADACFERDNATACATLASGCGAIKVSQTLGVTGTCNQTDQITQALENVLDVKLESDVSATSGVNLPLILGVVFGILALALVIGLIAWGVMRVNKNKKKKEQEEKTEEEEKEEKQTQRPQQRSRSAIQRQRRALADQAFSQTASASPPFRPDVGTSFESLPSLRSSA